MARQPLYYTFGNHMHWVDMEWLWGYHVLPGSVRDMIRLCREAGVKGCVNFDGIGYEKLAAEDPEALFELRSAVQEGTIEPVGCSYGQPYGLFHGGESNIRQLIYGARAVRRLLGVWPKTFWEEEFYFFPQLPQMLAGCGFTGASLFFQWTWHTPEVPKEESPVVWWEGLDGTRLLAATRNRLNMHQWPEDMDAVLKDVASASSPVVPLIQQWLELMPSPDWMCRSDLILPKLRELLTDERFEIKVVTLGEYLKEVASASSSIRSHEYKEIDKRQGAQLPVNHRWDADATGSLPVRKYTMDQVWHGLTLGKNGDDMRARSGKAERSIRLAEVLSAVAGVFGRPYPQWDVYPVWEIEEAWRELLMAQHHDNDECEGLCGRVGKRQYERAEGMAADIAANVFRRFAGQGPYALTFNPLGWRVHGWAGTRTVRPFCFSSKAWRSPGLSMAIDEANGRLKQDERDHSLQATYDLNLGALTSLKHFGGPDVASEDKPIGRLFVGDQPVPLEYQNAYDEDGQYILVTYQLDRPNEFDQPSEAVIQVDRASPHHGVDISFNWNESFSDLLADVTPGFKGALTFEIPLPWLNAEIYADTPYAVERVGSGSSGVRKYPEGDWMTSPQWFEAVEGAFTSYAVVDIVDPARGEGLLIAHKGNQQWFIREGALRCVLAAEDPWDADFFRKNQGNAWDGNSWLAGGEFRLHPHGPIDHAERWKIGQEFQQKWVPHGSVEFAFADIEPHHVVVTALYREAEDFAGKHVENYAGAEMGYPYILRLVELNGEDTNVELTIIGPVAKAFKTNLLGQIEEELTPTASHQEGEFQYDILRFPMRAHEIATLYLDIVPGRKQTRDLDAKREIWATVHRVDE